MNRENYRVIVVDDDFMIAKLHGKYVDQQEGYELIGIAHNYEQTLSRIREYPPDLIILDVYLPDRSGIEVLRTIRSEKIPCDVILITAAKEIDIIEEAFRLGIFDYLIKPFDLDLLKDTLIKYNLFKTHLQSHLQSPVQPNQEFVEGLKKFRAAKPLAVQHMQKGIDNRTLERIKQCLMKDREHRGAEQIAHLAGVSRSTARAYLDYLIEQGVAEESLQYGTIGRPQRLFRMKKVSETNKK
jgi:response regulator of citrate/malate metabolism